MSQNAIYRYPTAIVGLLIILSLVVLAGYALSQYTYQEAVDLWRGDENTWAETPRNAIPRWLNILQGYNWPETIKFSTLDNPELKERIDYEYYAVVTTEMSFDYQYDAFPSEMAIFYTSPVDSERPFVTAYWDTPDGRSIELEARSINPSQRVYLNLDQNLQQLFGNTPVEVGLFMDPTAETPTVLKGQYKLRLESYLFDEVADVDAKLVVYGKVHGWAGTDHRRRDMMVALLFGTPIALAFGFLAALGSTLTTFLISAIGVWYGRWVDALIQRITEVNMILPSLPILIMVGTFYSRSIWVILGVVILQGIFGGGVKTYRSIFLQVKNSPYIDAARVYGASNTRLIFRYMIPRIVPVLIPSFVTLIPSYVFLEASLALLGLGDPVLPTWGKLLQDAGENGALFKGYYYWLAQPAALLMLTGFGFAMVGFALDRIYNPRLRGR
jgi:peptide/nickel transport system permease protein